MHKKKEKKNHRFLAAHSNFTVVKMSILNTTSNGYPSRLPFNVSLEVQ